MTLEWLSLTKPTTGYPVRTRLTKTLGKQDKAAKAKLETFHSLARQQGRVDLVMTMEEVQEAD